MSGVLTSLPARKTDAERKQRPRPYRCAQKPEETFKRPVKFGAASGGEAPNPTPAKNGKVTAIVASTSEKPERGETG